MKQRISIYPLLCCLLITAPFILRAQQVATTDPTWLQWKWNASWISCPGTSLKDYNVFHFRKTFELTDKPAKFIINVSGDNRYRLYVNGVELCNGPARGDLVNWRFETVDIASHLKAGKNVLAAVVWNFGEYAPLAQMSYKTGFIVQGNTAAEEIVNTNETWKVCRDEAYKAPVRRPARTVVGPGDEVDGALYPFGWEQAPYDDNSWLPPRLLGKGVPYGKFTGGDWMLVPRNIPFMEHRLQRINEVERTEGITVDPRFLTGESPLKIPANKKVKILLDQTFLTTAYPLIKINGGKGSIITIGYAEALTDSNGIKGNRNDTKGKKMDSDYVDIFKPGDREGQTFQPLWFRTYRYMELVIETSDEPLVVQDVYGYFTAYPFEQRAFFQSDDPLLTDIWNTGWRTARLCAGETYYDCPYYEQLQYTGDTRIQALISLYVAGDDRLMRNAIEQFRRSLLPEGLTQSRYPSSQLQIIPPFSLFWIAMVHDFWMNRDDKDLVIRQLTGIKSVLRWYEQQIDSTGMLGAMDWWNFVDWSFGPWQPNKPSGGVPPGGMEGHSSILTLQYAYVLQMAADLFDAFNEPVQAARYKKLAATLQEKTYSLCWGAAKGLLADTPEKTAFSQHANVLGLLTGMFDKRQPQIIMRNLLIRPDVVPCTYYFRFYLHRALEKAGMADEYLPLLTPWKEMLQLGLSTFAERPEPTRSDCHAWSASPNYDFLSLVSGIQPASAGFKTVRIAPHPGKLRQIDVSVPHEKGDIKMSWRKKGETAMSATIELPQGLSGVFEWKGRTVKLVAGKQEIEL